MCKPNEREAREAELKRRFGTLPAKDDSAIEIVINAHGEVLMWAAGTKEYADKLGTNTGEG